MLSSRTRLLSLVFLLPAAALAAPHADPLQVDLWSRMDEFHAARGVQRPVTARPLKRAAPDPRLDLLINPFLDANPNTGLLVLKGDTILAERYQYTRTPQARFASASVAKTVIGMLVGIALHEKRISSLDDKAGDYIAKLRGHPYGDTSIRNLLTMSSGVAFNEAWTGRTGRDDGLKLISNTLRRGTDGGIDAILEFDKRETPQGTQFRYASGDSQVLALVLIAALRQPLAEYLSEKIWRPMGAEAHATWLLDKSGHELGFCCLNAVLRDYARFGMLLANYGELDGKQIIPAEWVRAAITPQAEHLKVGAVTPNNGYGYQTWITSRDEPSHFPRFAALGMHGQAIFVDPATKLVVVHTAVWADPDDRAARGAQFRLFRAIHTRLSTQ